MKKKGGKKKSFFRRGIAVFLCCFCLLAAVPADAMALEETDSAVQTDENQEAESTKESGLCKNTEETELITEKQEETSGEVLKEKKQEETQEEAQEEKQEETQEQTQEEIQEEKQKETQKESQVEALKEENGKSTALEAMAQTDTPTTLASIGTFRISHKLSHVEMVYCHYQGASDAATAPFVAVADGDTHTATSRDGGYYLYFVKPEPGYLLTEFRGYNNVALDLYAVDAKSVYIDGYESISTVLGRAKDLGYIGYFGYRSSAMTWNANVTHVISADKPKMSVVATAEPNKNIEPDQEVTFTITVIPGHTGVGTDKITSINITSIKINGKDYPMEMVTDNRDGTYSLKYTVSYEDWKQKSAKLDVTASIGYINTLSLTDTHKNTSTITTTTVVDGSASTNCDFAEYLMKKLTVVKRVSGNMYDEDKAFTFTIAADLEMTYGRQTGKTITLDLKKDGEAEILVPAGVHISVVEDPDGYEYAFDETASTITSYENLEHGIAFTMPEADTTITIHNRKNVLVDTGVISDSMPYVILLTISVVGGTFGVNGSRRRKGGERTHS